MLTTFGTGMLQVWPDKQDETQTSNTHSIILPPTTVPGTVVANLHIIRSPAEQLGNSLSVLVREPNGCFEQVQFFFPHPL